jgi:short-subunit dehydrogenase
MKKINYKKAIILGASSGIGKGLARLLVARNYIVGITGRRESLLQELKNENPESYIIKPFDISDSKHVSHKLNELSDELGGLDLFVVSSGYGELNDPLDFDIEKQTIDTNVAGFTAAADWAFNYFKNQCYGHLVAITSIAGIRGYRDAPAYNASKSYQINYLEGLRLKAYKQKLPLTITDIRPGFVDTPMAKGDYKFWVASVDDAVSGIYRAIANKSRVAYVTRRWAMVAFLYKLLPLFIYKRA